MSPSTAAAICISLTAGMTKAEILAVAIKNALESYKANREGKTR